MPAPTMNLPVNTSVTPRQTTVEQLEAEINRMVKILWDQSSAIASGSVPAGDWDPASGSFPSGSVVGTFYNVVNPGTVDGVAFEAGTRLYPLVNGASTTTYAANWSRSILVLDGKRFHRVFLNVAALLADTSNDYPTGCRVFCEEEGIEYLYLGTSGGLVQSAATTPQHFSPVPEKYFGVDIRAAGGPAGFGADNHALHQAAIDYADSIGAGIYLGVDLDYEGRSTYVWGDCDIAGLRCQILTPPSGTYNEFVYDNGDGVTTFTGVTPLPDSIPAAHDFTGISRQVLGFITLLGQTGLNDWTMASRVTCSDNLVGFGGLRGGVADTTINGNITCQGFAHPWFVPSSESGQVTRAFTRMRGYLRSRFCGTPIGRILGGANGLDDVDLFIRSDRCGLFGTVQESILNKCTLSASSIYARGLFTSDWQDAEPGTVTINGTNIIELSVASAYLQANDWIMLEDATTRALTDDAVVNLVCKVQSVVGTTVTLYNEDENIPTRGTLGVPISGLHWCLRPPAIVVSATAKINAQRCYFEDTWDTIEVQSGGSFVCPDLKLGGTKITGRNGCVLAATGREFNIDVTLENTTTVSVATQAVVGTILPRRTSDSYDFGGNIVVRSGRSVLTSESSVLLVKANNALEFFTDAGDPTVNRWGSVHRGHNIRKVMSGQEHTGYFLANRTFRTTKVEGGGRVIAGSNDLAGNALTQAQRFNITLDGTLQDLITFTPADAEVDTQWPAGTWTVHISVPNNDEYGAAIVHVPVGGATGLTTVASSELTFTLSGDILQVEYTGAGTRVANVAAYRTTGASTIPVPV